MEQQKRIGKLNILGSTLAFLITAYITVIYILIMAGSTPGCLAYEITRPDYAPYFMGRFVTVVIMYLCCLVNLISIPAYIAYKAKGREYDAKKKRVLGIAQVVSSVVMFILIIVFWTSCGAAFDSNMATPFATPYRIIELILSILQVAAVLLTTLYSVDNDVIRTLKKKYNKI